MNDHFFVVTHRQSTAKHNLFLAENTAGQKQRCRGQLTKRNLKHAKAGSVQNAVSKMTPTDSEDITSWQHSTVNTRSSNFTVECCH